MTTTKNELTRLAGPLAVEAEASVGLRDEDAGTLFRRVEGVLVIALRVEISLSSTRTEPVTGMDGCTVLAGHLSTMLGTRNRKAGPGWISYSYLRMGSFYTNCSIPVPEFLIFLQISVRFPYLSFSCSY